MGVGSSRNNACNVAAHSLGTMVGAGWIDASKVATALLGAMVANGWAAKRSMEAAKATILSGLSKGSEKPRPSLTDGDLPLVDISGLKIGGKPARAILDAATGNGRQAASPAPRSIVLKGLSDVREEAVRWLWPGYLPAGMLTLLSGAGGTGKSTIAFSLAATVTTGGHWPDGTRCYSPGVVLIWSSEDDMARTIKPRLIAAGADIRYVAEITATDERGMKQGFDPSRDIAGLRAAVQQAGGVSLLIIDPIVSAVAGDINKANDVRRNLQPIVDFATEFDCAVIGITHFGKNTGGRNTAERVIGSQAFAALARMVLATAKEKDSDRRVFARSKSNISADGGGFSYTIEQLTIQASEGRLLPTTRVVWGEPIDGSAHAILEEIEADELPQSSKKMDEAKNFLYQVLERGAVPVTQVKSQARASGIASITLQRAKEAMNIQSSKCRGDFVGAWEWRLPHQQIAPPAELLR
jgi:Mrp family chromosome partitioning ATPase